MAISSNCRRLYPFPEVLSSCQKASPLSASCNNWVTRARLIPSRRPNVSALEPRIFSQLGSPGKRLGDRGKWIGDAGLLPPGAEVNSAPGRGRNPKMDRRDAERRQPSLGVREANRKAQPEGPGKFVTSLVPPSHSTPASRCSASAHGRPSEARPESNALSKRSACRRAYQISPSSENDAPRAKRIFGMIMERDHLPSVARPAFGDGGFWVYLLQ